jgi:hypothetical protein
MKNYGVELKVRTYPVGPASMNLSGDAGRRIVMAAAKRVMMTPQPHSKPWLSDSSHAGLCCSPPISIYHFTRKANMSTKSSIASGPNFHFYHEVFDDENVYLDLQNVPFEASERHVMMAIPVAIWEVIRQTPPVDLSFSDKTDEDIQHLVESEVQKRLTDFAAADVRKKSILQLSGASVNGSPDDPQEEQIAKGLIYYTQLRLRQLKLRQDIADLQNQQ